MEIETHADAGQLARAAAEHFVKLATQAIENRQRFSVALAGGSTPKALYTLLATDAFRSRLDWCSTHVFWGDERCLPSDHADSNYRMAREALLDHVPLPASNVHRMEGGDEPEAAAAQYERTLRVFFSESDSAESERLQQPGHFDLVLLGMGADGHTASIFPGTVAVCERERWVVAHRVAQLGVWRITLTPVVLNAARGVIFLVSGRNKADRLREVLTRPYEPESLPAQVVKPSAGNLLWLVDSEAAACL